MLCDRLKTFNYVVVRIETVKKLKRLENKPNQNPTNNNCAVETKSLQTLKYSCLS